MPKKKAKKAAKATTAKKGTAKKATPKKSTAKKSTAKKATAKKKATGPKKAGKKAAAKKSTAKKSTVKKAAVTKAAAPKKAPPKKDASSKKVAPAAKKAATAGATSKNAAGTEAPVTKKKTATKKAAPRPAPQPEEPPPPKVQPLSKRISKKNVDAIRGRLLERRSELFGALSGADVRAQDHSVQAGGDEIDAATYSVAADLSLRMAESESRELKEIQLALGKLEDGSYGVCEATGKPIDVRRLLFMPTARLSLEAQEQLEREQLYHDNELGWVSTEF